MSNDLGILFFLHTKFTWIIIVLIKIQYSMLYAVKLNMKGKWADEKDY